MRLLLAGLVACSGPQPAPAPRPIAQADAAIVGPDAPEASQEERLAAIQKAMNELDEAAQGCWAIAATDRFDIQGDVEVMVDIGANGAKTQVMRDTTRNSRLLACLSDLLSKYRWAPPLHGQAIQLPFKFKAPTGGQNTIDRRLVTWNGQGKVSVAVLIDFNNTGSAHASILEVAIQAGGRTGLRVPERAELWYFLNPAIVNNKPVAAGDMVYVPLEAGRDVHAKDGDVHAMLAYVPGGREGVARAGALPAQELDGKPKKQPVILPAAKAKTYGPATIFVEPATVNGAPFAASVISLPKDMTVPEHVHAAEAELLYILSGSGTMTVDGAKLPITSTTVVQVPPSTKHAFTAAEDVRAVQIYTPAGPEQRFKTRPK